MGPLTGRAAGYCAGNNSPGFMNFFGGRLGTGFRRGRGRGWGVPYPAGGSWGSPYGANYAPSYSTEQEKEALQGQAKFFEDQLTALRERIDQLEAETDKTK
jgi:hypothetical protein